MGYTHYYSQKREMTSEEFDGFAKDVERLIAALPKTISDFDENFGRGGYGYGPRSPDVLAVSHDDPDRPMVSKDAVSFNGAGYADANHETFQVVRLQDKSHYSFDKGKGETFNFTKTARKPYDALVCASLLALKSRAGSAWSISSDGDAGEWVASARFARYALGRPMPLGKISNFANEKKDLMAAREPSSREVALKEQQQLGKTVSKGVVKGLGKHSL